MQVRFLKAHSWKPNVNSTIDFPAGAEYGMPAAAAEKLIEAGIVEKIGSMPKRPGAASAPKAETKDE